MIRQVLVCSMSLLIVQASTFGDGPADNNPGTVRPIPPIGIEVSKGDHEELQAALADLRGRISELRASKNATAQRYWPDVEIFHRAVNDALTFMEIYSPQEIKQAKELLAQGNHRAVELAAGKAPWTEQTGLIVRGFVSKLDQSVQPYGLVIPETYSPRGPRVRLDVWLHGRGEKVTELAFLSQRQKQVGQISPSDTIVLHPYGRYSNAFKFAGEVDVLEARAHVEDHYRIDAQKVAIRGFSMGGAGCWQFAVHYPDLWFAATPGAGFSETPEFLRSFQQETLTPTPWEKTLWRLYDCPGYAVNLLQCPTIAYSGELDSQKQAADMMESALSAQNISLVHLIGPQTKHAIHADAAIETERRLTSLAKLDRNLAPPRIQFATFTLRYNRCYWLTVTGLESHWERATVDARVENGNRLVVTTSNVSAMKFDFPAGWSPFDAQTPVTLIVNGVTTVGPRPLSDQSWSMSWRAPSYSSGLRKQHGLQGPIDDAFMDSFIVVRPTGKAAHAAVDTWTQDELQRFLEHWRRHFRGYAVVKDDHAITPEDAASCNLILFGDPSSNSLLRNLVSQLPIQWNRTTLTMGLSSFDAEHHAPAMVFPNPMQPDRYVVLNSGFTFRDYDYLNNARQVPRLPDWAVIDVREPAGSQYAGKVVTADFFDEQWRFKSP